MQVIEELDNAKKGMSEASRNARQVSRFINELIENGNGRHIEDGLELSRQRRDLPWERVDKRYDFETPNGPATLPELGPLHT